MNISIVASREDLDQAVKAARAFSPFNQNTHLNATANATLLGRLNIVWDSIESALKKGYSIGADAARGALTSAVAQAEQLIAEAGAFAKDCREILMEKLQLFVRGFINSALKRVPDSLAIAGREFRISKVICTQKLVLGGNLTTNVAEVFALTSSGELELGVEYEVPVTPAP